MRVTDAARRLNAFKFVSGVRRRVGPAWNGRLTIKCQLSNVVSCPFCPCSPTGASPFPLLYIPLLPCLLPYQLIHIPSCSARTVFILFFFSWILSPPRPPRIFNRNGILEVCSRGSRHSRRSSRGFRAGGSPRAEPGLASQLGRSSSPPGSLRRHRRSCVRICGQDLSAPRSPSLCSPTAFCRLIRSSVSSSSWLLDIYSYSSSFRHHILWIYYWTTVACSVFIILSRFPCTFSACARRLSYIVDGFLDVLLIVFT